MEGNDNIALRSEKIRHIIGRIPPMLIRSGIGILSAIVFLLILAACLIPYPENITVPVKVTRIVPENKGTARAFIPYVRILEMKLGMRVAMQFEGYNANTYGYVEGHINRVHRTVVQSTSGDCFIADIAFEQPVRYFVVVNQEGSASLCLSNGSLVERLFSNSRFSSE